MSKKAMKLALEALEEIDGSVKLYHRLGPDWTHKDGTEVFEVSVLLDRSELIEKAITAINEALAEESSGVEQPAQPQQEPVAGIDEMVNRFLAWPLPESVCTDPCTSWPGYSHSRFGTSLLTAIEARQMLEHVFQDTSPPAQRKPKTEEFIKHAWANSAPNIGFGDFLVLFRAIEAVHGIKGGA